jgi:hypothetical protein
MAKGQKKSNREAKKPKANKKPTVAAAPMRSETTARITGQKNAK